MSRISKLTEKKNPYAPTAQNLEGYPSFYKDIKEAYVQTLLTNTLGNTYYLDSQDMIDVAMQLHEKVVNDDPLFAAKALVYARNSGFIRSQPILGLSMLSRKSPQLFKQIFNQIIKTPNDMSDFLCLRGSGGRAVKTAVANWLMNNLSEYYAIKYGSEGKQGYTLKDMIKVSHPNYGTKDNLINYLLGKEFNLAELPKVAALEKLKNATTEKERVEAIELGGLPHEVVTPFITKKKSWKALVKNMPILALIKNLATIERHEAMTSKTVQHISSIFTNPEIIAKSKVFPYRFIEAAKHVSNSEIQDALREAVEISVKNIPEIKGTVSVLLDISGSMAPSYNNGTDLMQTAAIHALSILKRSEGGKLITFDTVAQETSWSKIDSILTQANNIHTRGGTDTSCPIDLMISKGIKTDSIVLITDEQQNQGEPFYKTFDRYRKTVNPNVKLFVVDVSPYLSALADPNDKNVNYLYGKSDKLLYMISLLQQGWSSVVGEINKQNI